MSHAEKLDLILAELTLAKQEYEEDRKRIINETGFRSLPDTLDSLTLRCTYILLIVDTLLERTSYYGKITGRIS